MDPIVFIGIFSVLAIFYFILGISTSSKVNNLNDYFLAGRNLGLMPVTMSLVATQIGGGMLLGTTQQAYSVGFYGILYTVGMTIGFLILGSGLAARLRGLNITVTAELFETRYKSVWLKRFASLLAAVTMGGLLIGQIIGSKALLSGIGISNEWIFLGFWTLVIIYTMVGGLHAVVLTDVVQVWYILLVFSAIFLYSLFFDPSGISFFSSSDGVSLFSAMKQETFSFKGLTSATIMATILMPALFSLFEQDLAQRFFASRTQKIATLSAFLSGGIMILFSLVPIYFGMYARLNNLAIPAGGSPLLPAISAITNEFVVALAVCGIIAAITSTADSLMCAMTSKIVIGLDVGSWVTEKKQLAFSQIITMLTGIVAIAASYFATQDIIGIMISSYELSVSCLLISTLFAYFYTGLNKNAAIGSILFGIAGFIAFRIWPLPVPRELATLALSLLGYWIGNKIKTTK